MSSYILLKHNKEGNTTTTQTLSPNEEGGGISLGDSNTFTIDLGIIIMLCLIGFIAIALYLWIRPLCLEIKRVEQKLFARDVAEEVCKKMKDEL